MSGLSTLLYSASLQDEAIFPADFTRWTFPLGDLFLSSGVHSTNSLLVDCFRFSGVFCDIPSIKAYRLPRLRIFLAQGLQTRSEKFSSRSIEIPVFFKTSANTTLRQSFLLEGLNRFSRDKYLSF